MILKGKEAKETYIATVLAQGYPDVDEPEAKRWASDVVAAVKLSDKQGGHAYHYYMREQVRTSIPISEGQSRDYADALDICVKLMTDEETFVRHNLHYIDREIARMERSPALGVEIVQGLAYLIPCSDRDWRGDSVVTREETEALVAALRYKRDDHAKRVRAYLKRYGLDKVQAWTYWDMA